MAKLNVSGKENLVYVLLDSDGNSPVKQELREDGFINEGDQVYLSSYAIENLIDLCQREHFNKFEDLMKNQTKISRLGRA